MKTKYLYRFGLQAEIRMTKIFCYSILLLIFFTLPAKPQLVNKTLSETTKDLFYFDPIVFYSKEQQKPRLDAYIEIPLENLQFKKNYSTKLYDASINYIVTITNSIGETVVNESIKDYVSTTKSEQKKLPETAKYIIKEFYLNPGKYLVEITLTDLNTKKEKTIKSRIQVDDFVQKVISFSDIMLVSNLQQDKGKKIITPLVDKNIDNLNQLFLFFEVYNSDIEVLKNDYNYTITNSKDVVVEKGVFNLTLSPGTNKFFEKISTSNLVFGDYKLVLSDSKDGSLISEKIFTNKMDGIPVNIKDLNLLIDQMMYIANGEELDKIKKAPNNDLKMKYFIEFWRNRDPSPNTSRNELMVEYYNRVKTANERYSHYIDGWKTDMGMVYIIFGEPSNIERFPFTENTKPYEIWTFYAVNRQFVFVDDSGFGDYRLTIPIWDDNATRIKN